MIQGLLAGFAAHQLRPVIERETPQGDGLFPFACYLVGGLTVVAVYSLLHGPKRGQELLGVFATVGLGVWAGWLFDGFVGR